jgi:predicted metalloprotease with PDZ domain
MKFSLPTGPAIFAAIISLGTATASAQCLFPTKDPGRVLAYTFEAKPAETGMILHVTLEFHGNETGIEKIDIPVNWAGETLNAVINLRALSPNTSIVDGSDSGNKIVKFVPKQPVLLAYDLVKDWQGPLVNPKQFHPVIMPDYIEINGDNALIRPKLDPEALVTVNFDWQMLPVDWVLTTSFGTAIDQSQRCQTFSGEWRRTVEALFTAGVFRIRHFEIKGQPAVLAIRGTWSFTDDEAIQDIQQSVGVVRDFWRDYNVPYYLVTVKPYDTGYGQTDGSGFTNAFWMYMSPGDQISSLMPDLIHEAFHGWNPLKMGYEPNDDLTPAPLEWFTEGFTMYYEDLLAHRVGIMKMPDYLDDINHDLRDYSTSTSGYVRGPVIALWLDTEIRNESKNKHSLDNVMFDLVRRGNVPLTQNHVLETANHYLNRAAQAKLAEMARPNSPVPTFTGSSVMSGCVQVTIDPVQKFDLGFDIKSSMVSHQIIGVREDSSAFLTGLRNGQKFTHVSVYNDHPEKQATFQVQMADGTSQTIEYYPSMLVTVPQLHSSQSTNSIERGRCGL